MSVPGEYEMNVPNEEHEYKVLILSEYKPKSIYTLVIYFICFVFYNRYMVWNIVVHIKLSLFRFRENQAKEKTSKDTFFRN